MYSYDTRSIVRTVLLNLVNDHVDDNEGAGATNAGRAVHGHGRLVQLVVVQLIEVIEELESALGVLRHAVVTPRHVLIVVYDA